VIKRKRERERERNIETFFLYFRSVPKYRFGLLYIYKTHTANGRSCPTKAKSNAKKREKKDKKEEKKRGERERERERKERKNRELARSRPHVNALT
jgi:hypothetical protein